MIHSIEEETVRVHTQVDTHTTLHTTHTYFISLSRSNSASCFACSFVSLSLSLGLTEPLRLLVKPRPWSVEEW